PGTQGADGSPARTDFIIKGYVDGPRQNADGSYNNGDPAIVDAQTVAAALPNDRVVLVDWTDAANPDGSGGASDAFNPVNYQHAAENAVTVGDELALWAQQNNVAPASIDVFGQGLGAQVAGELGAMIQQIEPGDVLDAIYAADPAGLGFSGRDAGDRLNSNDAIKVVAIHTTQTLGDTEDVGTTDQFVTGASFNPVAAANQAWSLLLQSISDSTLETTGGHGVGYAADAPGEQIYALPSGTQRTAQHVEASGQLAQALAGQLVNLVSTTATAATNLVDPTDVVSVAGPAGVGAKNFITTDATLPYQINFEDAAATNTPVQSVTV